MPNTTNDEKTKSGPSGATDKTSERETKFDDEGGAQPQAESEDVADKLLHPDQSQGPDEPPGRSEGEQPGGPDPLCERTGGLRPRSD